MRQNMRSLAFMGAAIAVIGLVLVFLILGKGQKKEEETTSAVDPIVLLDKTAADLSSLKIENEKGSFTLKPELPQNKEGQDGQPSLIFRVEELEGLPLDTTVTDQTARYGYALMALEEIGQVERPREFGFEPARATVEASYWNGEKASYEIGGEAPGGDGCYIRMGNMVYLIDISNLLLSDKSVFVSEKILDFTQETLPEFQNIQMEGTAMQEAVSLERTESGYDITAPMRAPMDGNQAVALTDLLTNLNAQEAAAVYPQQQDLEQYGLAEPAHILRFTKEGRSYSIKAGALDGDNRYLMLEGIPVVYRVMETGLYPWIDTKAAFDLRSKNLIQHPADEVSEIHTSYNGQADQYEIRREVNEEKSTDDKTIYRYTVTKDGTSVMDYDTGYQAFYKKITALTLLEAAREKPDGTPVGTITLRYFESDNTDTLEFYAVDERRLTAVLNGEVCGNITRNDLAFLQPQ